jgi:SOS response associated peptidase (SRAP)
VANRAARARLSSDVSEIKLVFSIPPHQPAPNIEPSWNVAPTDPLPVVGYDASAGERSLDVMRWGLVPFWPEDIKVGFANINAKAEGIEGKPALREAFQRRRSSCRDLLNDPLVFDTNYAPPRTAITIAGSPEMDELNIIAAILALLPLSDTSLPAAIHLDPARNIAVQTVTLYERIIDELRARGHGRVAPDSALPTDSQKAFAELHNSPGKVGDSRNSVPPRDSLTVGCEG